MAYAEWQVKPFVGLALGSHTTFQDSELAVEKVHTLVGVSGAFIGEVLGVEADFGRASGFFQKGDGRIRAPQEPFVIKSNVTTLTGNVTVSLPKRLAEYTLRPYFVGGAGLMHVRADNFITTLSASDNRPSMDLGGGVTGFLTRRIGVNWDVRHFRTVQNKSEALGVSVGGRLSFWRANMALAIRY